MFTLDEGASSSPVIRDDICVVETSLSFYLGLCVAWERVQALLVTIEHVKYTLSILYVSIRLTGYDFFLISALASVCLVYALLVGRMSDVLRYETEFKCISFSDNIDIVYMLLLELYGSLDSELLRLNFQWECGGSLKRMSVFRYAFLLKSISCTLE